MTNCKASDTIMSEQRKGHKPIKRSGRVGHKRAERKNEMTNLELTLAEACDLLVAVDLQEAKCRELADKGETDDADAYFSKKANRLHNIGNKLYYKAFGYKRKAR